jgi:uncharacterized protein
MAKFEGMAAVEAELDRLAARPDPLARRLTRRPGQKEERWIQLLTDQVSYAEPGDETEAASDRRVDRGDAAADIQMAAPNWSSGPWAALQLEVSELRAEVEQLRSALDDLRTQLGS